MLLWVSHDPVNSECQDTLVRSCPCRMRTAWKSEERVSELGSYVYVNRCRERGVSPCRALATLDCSHAVSSLRYIRRNTRKTSITCSDFRGHVRRWFASGENSELLAAKACCSKSRTRFGQKTNTTPHTTWVLELRGVASRSFDEVHPRHALFLSILVGEWKE